MDTRLAPLADILDLNTRLFLNCLGDIDDEAGLTRVSANSNNLTFVAVHVLDARAYLCGGRLMARLAGVSRAQLHATPSATFPISDSTVLGMVAFLVQHDSYHVG